MIPNLPRIVLLSLCANLILVFSADMPCPFTRELYYNPHSLQTGSDVFIMQNLLIRSPFVTKFTPNRVFDKQTMEAVKQFQTGNKIESSGRLNHNTAGLLLDRHLEDHYKDDKKIPQGYLYKVYIPVHKNRSIETIATLYNSQMAQLHKWRVRTHGQDDPVTHRALNQLCGDGNTPSGLMTFDLNSPEDDPKDFGPYPVNRAVQGLKGNAKVIISDIRDGILMHTGEWPNWNSSMPMPNSHGCIHGHPEDIKKVWQILVSLGVKVRPNTDGKLPYPYAPQGILSIEQLD